MLNVMLFGNARDEFVIRVNLKDRQVARRKRNRRRSNVKAVKLMLVPAPKLVTFSVITVPLTGLALVNDAERSVKSITPLTSV